VSGYIRFRKINKYEMGILKLKVSNTKQGKEVIDGVRNDDMQRIKLNNSYL